MYFGEVIRSGVGVVFLSLASSNSFCDDRHSRDWAKFIRVSAPVGILIGACCSVAVKDVDVDFLGAKINALNIPGVISALLWIIVLFVAVYMKITAPNSNRKYSLLQEKDTKMNQRIPLHLTTPFECSTLLRSLFSLMNQKFFLPLFFNYSVLTSAHILLILMIIILPRDFFSWDIYTAGVIPVAYGLVDVISVTILTFWDACDKSTIPFFILHGIISTLLGLVCCIIMHTIDTTGTSLRVLFCCAVIFLNCGFIFFSEGMQRLLATSGAMRHRSFGFAHLGNIFIVPRILSSLISGLMLDHLQGYCTFLVILLLFGKVAFLIHWHDFKLK